MDADMRELERKACVPALIRLEGFNSQAVIPFDCTIHHLYQAMQEFASFLQFVNEQLHTKDMPRLETLLMPANFSGVVSEFMNISIPKYCATLVKNTYHNGHPDMLPAGRYPGNAVQYAHEGIEVKASRYLKGWQGHNAEESWLMVFVFDSNRPADAAKGILPRPFRFVKAVGAHLTKEDWRFSGRSEQSRRTITASVTDSGYAKWRPTGSIVRMISTNVMRRLPLRQRMTSRNN
ncbi:MAG: hypothetical protein ABI068_17645 [Ktedonobacterales bacterium]